ncbi:MAG: transposase [Nanoarchaeota archaeon]
MKTYIAKLNCNQVSKQRILDTLKANLDVWNICSKIYFEKPKGGLKHLHSKAYYHIREKRPEIPSQIIIKAEQDVISAYRSIKSNKQKLTENAIKKKLSIQLDKRIYKIRGQEIQITSIGKGRTSAKIVFYPRLEEALKNGHQDPKLFEKKGDLWLAFPCKTPEPILKDTLSIGVDVGIKRAVSTTEGLFISRKDFNKKLGKFSFNKKKLQAKKTYSARNRLKKISKKHYNMSKNFTHNCVNKVLDTKADVIVIEWLRSLKSKSKGRYMNRRLSQWAYGEFRRILEYKAQILGKRVVTVNPAFTSQRDWRKIPNGKRQGCRYHASDGIVFDADWNAAMNIANLHTKVSQIPVSHIKVLDGQAKVISPIVTFGRLQAPEFIQG